MRLASFDGPAGESYGIVTDDGMIDLRRRLGATHPTLLSLLEADALHGLARFQSEPADLRLADITLLPPITAPQKIWCIGVNYADRNAEYRDQSEQPKYPSLFARAPTSFVGHGTPLERPRASEQLDYEGEIVLVIGKAGRRIAAADAWRHVAGLSLMNEGSVRDWLRH